MLKKRKKYKILGLVLIGLILFWTIVNLIPVKKVVENNPWRKQEQVLISAHRGGSNLNPENTEKAFDYVILETTYCDIVEIDVRLTKDDVIVINHDSTINDMALSEESEDVKISEYTYEELKKYNLGRNFKNSQNQCPYLEYSEEEASQEGLTLMSLDDFLNKYNNARDFRLLLEIKEEGDRGKKIVDMVMSCYEKSEYSWWKDRTMIISFEDDVINYTIDNYPKQYVGALGYKIVWEVVFQKIGLNSLYSADYQSLQISQTKKIGPLEIKLATKKMVKVAHKRNQTVACWTINDVEDMKKLIEMDVDIITTDSPDVLAKLLGKI